MFTKYMQCMLLPGDIERKREEENKERKRRAQDPEPERGPKINIQSQAAVAASKIWFLPVHYAR